MPLIGNWWPQSLKSWFPPITVVCCTVIIYHPSVRTSTMSFLRFTYKTCFFVRIFLESLIIFYCSGPRMNSNTMQKGILPCCIQAKHWSADKIWISAYMSLIKSKASDSNVSATRIRKGVGSIFWAHILKVSQLVVSGRKKIDGPLQCCDRLKT